MTPNPLNTLPPLATRLAAEGRFPEAIAAANQWVAANKKTASAYAFRADILERAGEVAAAVKDRLKARRLSPANAVIAGQYALTLAKAGQTALALQEFERSVVLSPSDPALRFNYGLALSRAGRADKALAAYEAALKFTPDTHPLWPNLLVNLANLYADAKRNDEARSLYERVLEKTPEHANARFNLAMLNIDTANRKDALDGLKRAYGADPTNARTAAQLMFQKLSACEWDDALYALARQVADAIQNNTADISPFTVLAMPDTTPELQRLCAANHSARYGSEGNPFRLKPSVPPPSLRGEAARQNRAAGGVEETPGTGGEPRVHRRLRVGYFSSDFKAHATVYLMQGVLEAHDRSKVEIFAISYGDDDQSPYRARLIQSVEHFIELANVPDEIAARQIAALDLDLLIDLKGYTEGNRSGLLRYRLAPVQVNWLGYPGTLAAPWVDVLIADAYIAPPEHRPYFSERVVDLPCYQPNSLDREVAAPPSRADEGLPEGALVLVSFNQTYKITPEIFGVWLGLLRDFPGTVLWLWASNPWAEPNLRRIAEDVGVDPLRLVFAEGKPQAEHLARYPLASLALDTFPVNGHTTTSDVLFMGVPVVTLSGKPLASRVAGSLLRRAGLPELVADDLAAYDAIIRRFLEDAAFRETVSAKARDAKKTDLFNSERFARDLEACFLGLCREA